MTRNDSSKQAWRPGNDYNMFAEIGRVMLPNVRHSSEFGPQTSSRCRRLPDPPQQPTLLSINGVRISTHTHFILSLLRSQNIPSLAKHVLPSSSDLILLCASSRSIRPCSGKLWQTRNFDDDDEESFYPRASLVINFTLGGKMESAAEPS